MSDPQPIAPDDVEVRPCEEADLEDVVAVSAAVAAEGRWIAREHIDRTQGIEHLRAYLRADDRVLLVAVVEGRPIANLGLTLEAGGVAELGMLVADGWRGRGVGSALMEAAIAWSRDRDAHKIALQVWPHNEAARALYRKFGFVEEGTLVRHYRRENGELWDAVVMGLVLDDTSPGSPH
jgi:RimJ/RimL family protein N-acetyltransferase